MQNKKQLKAQLTNEISKRFSNRIKELEDSRNTLLTKIEIERQQFKELQEKYLNLSQEFESLKDWNTQLMEFMDMFPEDRKTYVENMRASQQFNSQMIQLSRIMNYLNIF